MPTGRQQAIETIKKNSKVKAIDDRLDLQSTQISPFPLQNNLEQSQQIFTTGSPTPRFCTLKSPRNYLSSFVLELLSPTPLNFYGLFLY